MSDNSGVIQSTVLIITKGNERFEVVSHQTKDEFVKESKQRLDDKEAFVFAIKDPTEGSITIVLPHDTIRTIAVKAYSALAKTELKIQPLK